MDFKFSFKENRLCYAFPTSSEVSAGDDATAAQYNNLRTDALVAGGDYAVATGSGNAFAVALDTDAISYETGLMIKFQANHTISGTCTVNVNSLGAKTIKHNGTALNALQIQTNDFVLAIYDGTDFQMLSTPRVPMYFTMGYNVPGGTTGDDNNGASVYTDDKYYFPFKTNTATEFSVCDMRSGGDSEAYDITNDWAAADDIVGLVKLGDYLYVCAVDAAPANRVYRYAANDFASGGTLMTWTGIGTTVEVDLMICDGTYFYVNNDGGDTAASAHIWEKYSLSGTTLTADSKITCGAADANFTNALCDALGNFYGYNTTDKKIRRYNTSGTLQTTSTTALSSAARGFAWCIEGVPYYSRVGPSSPDMICFIPVPLLP